MDENHRDGRTAQRRVVVGLSGSLGSLAALHRGVAEARRAGAELVAVLAWEPPGGEFGYRRSPCPPLLAAVQEAAVARLGTALDEAFGGGDPGVPFRSLVIRGEAGRALVHAAGHPGDLLVLGAAGGPLHRGLRRSVPAYCARKAACPVLVVPRPALQLELEALHRRNLWHLPTEPLPVH